MQVTHSLSLSPLSGVSRPPLSERRRLRSPPSSSNDLHFLGRAERNLCDKRRFRVSLFISSFFSSSLNFFNFYGRARLCSLTVCYGPRSGVFFFVFPQISLSRLGRGGTAYLSFTWFSNYVPKDTKVQEQTKVCATRNKKLC